MENLNNNSGTQSKREMWQAHIEGQKNSELTQAAYCERHKLKLHNFHYWKRQLESKATGSSRLRFVPLGSPVHELARPSLDPYQQQTIKIHCGEVTMELPLSVSAHRLSELVGGLRDGGF